jgi:hypothetical protein
LLFAFGTVLSQRRPIPLPRNELTASQVFLGCIPLLIAGLLFEQAHSGALPTMAGSHWATRRSSRRACAIRCGSQQSGG